jgi:hypothetical protein
MSGEGSRDRVSSDVTRFNSDATIEAFSRMSDQGLIGETEASSGVVIGQFSVGDSGGKFVRCKLWAVILWRLKVWCEDYVCYSAVTFGVCGWVRLL